MSNKAALLLYGPIILVTIAVMAIAFCRDRKRPVIRSFLLLGLTAIGWEITAILYFLSWSVPVATYAYDVKLLFVAFVPIAFLLFVLRFYRLDQYVRPQLFALLSILPTITAILALTSPWHNLLRISLEVIALWPRQIVIFERGIWYWIHAGYSYLLVIVTVIIIVTQHLKLPKSRRLPSVFVLGGVSITIFCNVLAVLRLVSYPFNLTPISMGVSAILFYLALCSCSKMDFLMLVRNEIFHFIDNYVFVLDAEGKILDINRSAEGWLVELGIPQPVATFNDVVRFLEASGAEFRYAQDHDPGVDVSITTSHQTVIYNILEKRIVGDDGYEMGMFVTCTDVTRNRLLINRLEETAEVDALTGLQNRWGLDRMVAKILEEEQLPLTLIMGDVNGLKTINDTCGHQQGDLLLRETARALKEACPENGQAFRVGGDEFVVLLPGCGNAQAKTIIEDINKQLKEMRDYPFQISISLGHATEEHCPFTLEGLMQRADEDMYLHKQFPQFQLFDQEELSLTK